MNTQTVFINNVSIAVASSTQPHIVDVQSALDFIATIQYETGCSRVALNKEAISEDFFRLSTGLAGEILQKFTNYQMKLAIIGDFSRYTSKPLKDFIYESNQGNAIFFCSTEEEAVNKLASAR